MVFDILRIRPDYLNSYLYRVYLLKTNCRLHVNQCLRKWFFCSCFCEWTLLPHLRNTNWKRPEVRESRVRSSLTLKIQIQMLVLTLKRLKILIHNHTMDHSLMIVSLLGVQNTRNRPGLGDIELWCENQWRTGQLSWWPALVNNS